MINNSFPNLPYKVSNDGKLIRYIIMGFFYIITPLIIPVKLSISSSWRNSVIIHANYVIPSSVNEIIFVIKKWETIGMAD